MASSRKAKRRGVEKRETRARVELSNAGAAWLCAFKPEVVSVLARSAAPLAARATGWDGPRHGQVLAMLQDPKLTKVRTRAYLEQIDSAQVDQPPHEVVLAFRSVLSPLSSAELMEIFDRIWRGNRERYLDWQDAHAEILAEAAAGAAQMRRPFADCESSLEAEAWAQANYPLTTWDIGKADVHALNPSLRQFEKLAVLYPEAMAKLRLVQAAVIETYEDETERQARNIWALCGDGIITFNLRHYKNFANFEKRFSKAAAKDWSRAQDAAGIVSHEFGHHLHGFLLEDLTGPGYSEKDRDILLTSWGPKYKRALTPFTEGPVGTVGGMLSLWLEHNQEAISTYAKVSDSYAERFAEGFTSIHHDSPEQQPEFARRLSRVLDRLYDPTTWTQGVDVARSANKRTPPPNLDTASHRRRYLYPLMLELGLTPSVVNDLLDKAQDWQDRSRCLGTLKRDGLTAAVAQRRVQRKDREERMRLREGQQAEQQQIPEILGFDDLQQEAALSVPALSSLEDVPAPPPLQPLPLEPSFDR